MLPDSEFIPISRKTLIAIARQDGFEAVATALEKRTERMVSAAWSEESIEVK